MRAGAGEGDRDDGWGSGKAAYIETNERLNGSCDANK